MDVRMRIRQLCCLVALCGMSLAHTPEAWGQGWFGGGDKQAEKDLRQATSAYGSADYARVIEVTTKIIKEKSDYAKAYALRGKAYKDMGEVDKAYADLSAAIRLDATLGEAYFIRGQVNEIMGALAAAKKDYAAGCKNGYKLACDF